MASTVKHGLGVVELVLAATCMDTKFAHHTVGSGARLVPCCFSQSFSKAADNVSPTARAFSRLRKTRPLRPRTETSTMYPSGKNQQREVTVCCDCDDQLQLLPQDARAHARCSSRLPVSPGKLVVAPRLHVAQSVGSAPNTPACKTFRLENKTSHTTTRRWGKGVR